MDIQIEFADIALILSGFTALFAVVGPVVSTLFTNRSNERINREQIRYPRIYDAVKEMTITYNALQNHSEHIQGMNNASHKDVLDGYLGRANEFQLLFSKFSAASYLVISLIRNAHTQTAIVRLVDDIKARGLVPQQHNKQFCEIMRCISAELSQQKLIKRNRCKNKEKVNQS